MLRSRKALLLAVSLLVLMGIFSVCLNSNLNPDIKFTPSPYAYENAQFWGVPVSEDENSKITNEKPLYTPEDDYSFWGIPKELVKYSSANQKHPKI